MQNFIIAVIHACTTRFNKGRAQHRSQGFHSMSDYNRVHCKVACCTVNSTDVCDTPGGSLLLGPLHQSFGHTCTSMWSPFHSYACFLVTNVSESRVFHHTTWLSAVGSTRYSRCRTKLNRTTSPLPSCYMYTCMTTHPCQPATCIHV